MHCTRPSPEPILGISLSAFALLLLLRHERGGLLDVLRRDGRPFLELLDCQLRLGHVLDVCPLSLQLVDIFAQLLTVRVPRLDHLQQGPRDLGALELGANLEDASAEEAQLPA